VLAVVDRLHRSGTTIIHITHDAREAFRAQRVVVMVEGQIRLDLPSAELYPRAMCLKEWGLDVPLEVELWDRLTKRGFPLPDRIHSQEELVHAIWKLLSGV
jgi:energy-coupling factor transport system ATP-binding protein